MVATLKHMRSVFRNTVKRIILGRNKTGTPQKILDCSSFVLHQHCFGGVSVPCQKKKTRSAWDDKENTLFLFFSIKCHKTHSMIPFVIPLLSTSHHHNPTTDISKTPNTNKREPSLSTAFCVPHLPFLDSSLLFHPPLSFFIKLLP